MDLRAEESGSGSLDEPLYFPSGNFQLFAWLHRPTATAASDTGLVICKPFGYEATCGHRTMRVFAASAAQLGMPVLRFDYLGTGDSADGDPEADQIGPWLRDVVAAAAELRRRTAVTRVCLLGFRLGALLATLAAREAAADALLLIAPVVSGRRYLRELRTMALAGAGVVNAGQHDKPAATAGALEAGGYLLSAPTVARLSQSEVDTAEAAPADKVLIIDRDDLPSARAWSERLQQLGVRTRYLVAPGFVKMMMTPPQYAQVPQDMLQAARAWLLGCFATPRHVPGLMAVAARRAPASAELTLPGGTDGANDVWREHPVSFGPAGMLFGIITEPCRDERRRGAVILLNSGADVHIGAARMYVSIARRWAGRGYVVLRMDLAGLGDSATRPGRPEDEVFPPAAIDDMRAAVEFVRARYGVGEVTLAGLCSAAYHTLQAAIAGLQVNRILMVNPQNFSWKEGMEPGAVQLVDVVREMRGARERRLSLGTLQRLLRGQIDTRAVRRVYLQRARLAVEAAVREAARRLHVRLPRDLGSDLQRLVARGVRVVFIFARGEPGIELLQIQGGSAIRHLGDRCRVHIIDSADHTFTASGSRARMELILSDELFAPHT